MGGHRVDKGLMAAVAGVERVDLARLVQPRLGWLDGSDRALLRMYLEEGRTFRRIGRIVRRSETAVARRIRRLIAHLLDPTYLLCVRYGDRLPVDDLAIAKDFFARRLSMRRIAAQRNLTLYRVRRSLGRIRLVVEKAQSQDPAAVRSLFDETKPNLTIHKRSQSCRRTHSASHFVGRARSPRGSHTSVACSA